jgi:hypothetical protein
MRLHYLRGDRAIALPAFDRCEQVLKDEVDAKPLAETLDLLAQTERSQLPSAPAADWIFRTVAEHVPAALCESFLHSFPDPQAPVQQFGSTAADRTIHACPPTLGPGNPERELRACKPDCRVLHTISTNRPPNALRPVLAGGGVDTQSLRGRRWRSLTWR